MRSMPAASCNATTYGIARSISLSNAESDLLPLRDSSTNSLKNCGRGIEPIVVAGKSLLNNQYHCENLINIRPKMISLKLPQVLNLSVSLENITKSSDSLASN